MKIRNHKNYIITSVFLFGLLLPLNTGGAERPKTLEIGAKAPDFSLPGIAIEYKPSPKDAKKKVPVAVERIYTLQDFAKAKILVIIFTCNHCPTAQAYEGRMMKLAADYKKKGVAVAAISPNDPKAVRLDELGYTDVGDSLEDMKVRAVDQEFNFPYLYDGEKQKASRAYGPVTTPHVFIFDQERKLRFVGRIDNAEKIQRVKTHDTRNAIDALLAGKKVPVEKTKTMGCSIKWADKRGGVKQSLERWAKEEVRLEAVDKKTIQDLMKNDSEKLRLINVWATWCAACVAEFPEFVTMHRMYRKRDFEMITICGNIVEDKAKAHSFLKKNQASCRNVILNTNDQYEIIDAVDKNWTGVLPYTVLVAPGGKVLFKQVEGMIDPLEVKQTIVGYLGRTYK